MFRKVYVAVTAYFDLEGAITPLSFEWENGSVYAVDKVLEVRRAASTKVGGMGWRYTCRIQGKEKYLFYDLCDKRWFMEGRL